MFKSFYTKKVVTKGEDTKIDKAFDKITDAFDLLYPIPLAGLAHNLTI